jgi:long-chain acyl-CoA synthetase
VHDVLLYAARTHGNKKAFAARDVERVISEEKEVTKVVGGKQKKTWNYFKLKPFDWISYEEALATVKDISSGLREFGMGGEGETFFNIYGSTS